MDIKNKNFLLTENDEVRKLLLAQGLMELKKIGKFYAFVNEPKKLNSIEYSKLDLVATNKLYF